jgi:hypothetical protein
MPTSQQLNELADGLADDELQARLRKGALTDEAAGIFRAELASRGIAADTGAALTPLGPARSTVRRVNARGAVRYWTKRILGFPINALRGTEPPWVVIAFGGAILVGVYKAAIYGVIHVAIGRHLPQAAAISYGLLSVYALTALWLGVGLWSCAPRLGYRPGQIVLRVLAVGLVLNCAWGALAGARAVHSLLPAEAETRDIMQDLPPQS